MVDYRITPKRRLDRRLDRILEHNIYSLYLQIISLYICTIFL